jgi:hypothetical protein
VYGESASPADNRVTSTSSSVSRPLEREYVRVEPPGQQTFGIQRQRPFGRRERCGELAVEQFTRRQLPPTRLPERIDVNELAGERLNSGIAPPLR